MKTGKIKDPLLAFSSKYNLSPREQDVLDLMIERTVAADAIAQRLGITRNTVRIHVKNINSKVGACSKAEVLSAFILFLDRYYQRSLGKSVIEMAM
jgi:DNA-binding CsgD family transcriptional regulator